MPVSRGELDPDEEDKANGPQWLAWLLFVVGVTAAGAILIEIFLTAL